MLETRKSEHSKIRNPGHTRGILGAYAGCTQGIPRAYQAEHALGEPTRPGSTALHCTLRYPLKLRLCKEKHIWLEPCMNYGYLLIFDTLQNPEHRLLVKKAYEDIITNIRNWYNLVFQICDGYSFYSHGGIHFTIYGLFDVRFVFLGLPQIWT